MLMNPINQQGALYKAVSQVKNWNWQQERNNVRFNEKEFQLATIKKVGMPALRDMSQNAVGAAENYYWKGKNVNILA